MLEYLLLVDLPVSKYWYLLPLLVSISLVYAATRHELIQPILVHAFRFSVWIVGFLLVLFVLLYWFS